MKRTTRLLTYTIMPTRSSSRLQKGSPSLKREPSSPLTPPPAKTRRVKAEPSSPLVKAEDVKLENVKEENGTTPSKIDSTLRDRKLKQHTTISADGPFPTFAHPTPGECETAHRILSSLHGAKVRPAQVVASADRAGCGDSPSVLDALVRTILSQNTSDSNSTRAKLSMDKAYGGSDNWEEIAKGGQARLEEAIRCGGLSQVKSKVILRILDQASEKYGSYTLDHLHEASTEDAMQELLGFDGVGPKTASCVLLFCLQRDDFAVDTHVHRITGLLGWRPKKANREQTYAHLNRRIPDEHKYGLHILLVTHGKRCDECKAGGRNAGKCELRKAFRGDAEGVKTDAPVVKVVKEEKGDSGLSAKDEPEDVLVKVE